jgi:hypothetical protein
LLSSVEGADDYHEMPLADREQLHGAIERSFDQIDAGLTVPFDDVMVSLRAKRARRASALTWPSLSKWRMLEVAEACGTRASSRCYRPMALVPSLRR